MNIIDKRLSVYVSQNMNLFAIMVSVIFTTLSLSLSLSVVIASYSETSSGSYHFIHACKLSGEFYAYYHTRGSIFQLSASELTFTSANLPWESKAHVRRRL